MTSVSPIISITDTVHIIPSIILNVPPICSNTDTIFLSAIVSLKAAVKLNAIDRTVSFIIGIMHIASTTMIPTNPTAFFKTLPHPKNRINCFTEAIFRTTGIVLVTTALVVFTVSPVY